MKRKEFLRCLACTMGASALALALTACGGGDASVPEISAGAASVSSVATPDASPRRIKSLSPEEIAAVNYMREEEKLAHDVYTALFKVWGANVFSQIALSETTHTEAILALLVRYGLPDPAAGKAPGVFEDLALQALYNNLMVRGHASLIDALKVGALIEETDIHDIDQKKTVTDEEAILQVYDNLLCGSRNHLRAFNRQLLARGVTYVPQVIAQSDWDAIANEASETCGR